MAVTPKEKKMLQEMWNKSQSGGQGLPDGTYQFEITGARFHLSNKQRPQFKTKLKVVGGEEEFKGQELEINDNLETAENMGWFKKKLQRLNIAQTEDFDEVIDGTVADQMKGKVFEGQVKTKNDFLNVYVNRLIADSAGTASSKDEEEEVEDTKGEAASEIEEGSEVKWGNGKTGTVVEVLADDNQARVKKEDGTVVRVALNLLSINDETEEEEVEETEEEDKAPAKGKKAKDVDEDEESEEEEESENEKEFEVPEPDAVEDMKAGQVKDALSELGFEASDIKNARAVLHAFCTLAHDPKAKIQLEEIAPLSAALEVVVKKGAQFKDTLKALSAAVQERLG